MANMAKEGFLQAGIEETQQIVKKPRAEVRGEKKRGISFSGHNMVKAVIEKHQAMVHENQTNCCLPCQNGTATNPQTGRRHKGTIAPPPRPVPPKPRMPLRLLKTVREIKAQKRKVRHPDICIYILSFPAVNFSILIHMPRIACVIKILFPLC